MLTNAKVASRLPARDLNRARAFYSEKLGLDPVKQRDGGLRYVCAGGEFATFASAGVQSGTHTQMGWEVEDIEARCVSFARGESSSRRMICLA
jgi:catechol 2,3-dioxygenase-like lactoylglutathione lyase family enzyme